MQIVSVDQITGYIKDLFETDALLSDIWIRGEVTSLFESAAGHLYMTISDNQSKLKCVMFRGNRRSLLYLPVQGDQIVAHGSVSVYESNGEYQLYVDDIAPDGMGIFQLEFERLFRLLEAEGLFATDRKRQLPKYPAYVGVVTSAQGAVWHDIQTVVQRRFPLAELIIAPAQVQGSQAARSLITGLEAIQADGRSMVVIIGRGGGSPEDLASFNDEALARAIFASKIPVVSAVGHETDVTIADFVADVRAATPSAAAELVVPNRIELRESIGERLNSVLQNLVHTVSEEYHRHQIVTSDLKSRLGPASRIDRLRQDLDRDTMKLETAVSDIFRQYEIDLNSRKEKLELLDPKNVLRRGYAVVQVDSDSGNVKISSAKQARSITTAQVWFDDGCASTVFTGES